MRGCLWVGLAAGCIPGAAVDVPAEIDWIAWIPAATATTEVPDDLPAHRLLFATSRLLAWPSDADGWLIGFTAQQIDAAGLGDNQAAEFALVRPIDGCQQALPTPRWVRGWSQDATTLPALTSDRLPPSSCPVTANSFEVRAYEIAATNLTAVIGFGFTHDLTTPLVTLSSGEVFRLTKDGPAVEGVNEDRRIESVVRLDGGYWALEGGRLLFGSEVGALVARPSAIDDRRQNAVLRYTARFGLVAVNARGEILDIARDRLRRPQNTPLFGSPDDLQIDEDPAGNVVAAGTGWSWRWDGQTFENDIGLRRPFALVGSLPVFGDRVGAVRTPAPSSADGSRIIGDVTAVRSTGFDAPILTMVAYGDGVMVGDFSGYVSWVGIDGAIVTVAHLLLEPQYMFRVGDDVIVVSKDINAQIFYSGTETNVNVHVLERVD